MNVQNVQKTVVVKKSTSPRLRAYLIVVRVFQFVLFAIRKLGFTSVLGTSWLVGGFQGRVKTLGTRLGAYLYGAYHWSQK